MTINDRRKRALALILFLVLLLLPLGQLSATARPYYYRVRLSWTDVASQKGAFIILQNAINMASGLPGYKVFNEEGAVVWPETATEAPKVTQPDSADLDLSRLTPALRDEYNASLAALTAAQAAVTAADAKLRSYNGVPVLPGDYYEKRSWLDQLNAGLSPIPAATVKYHNLYNIGSTPDTSRIDGARINGTVFAMGNKIPEPALRERYQLPWTSYERAATGGAIYIREEFIDRGQDTSYFQKFNVAQDSQTRIWHQYMQGIQAPWSESRRMHAAYANSNTLAGEIFFEIPVFPGMPGADLPPRTAGAAAATEGGEGTADPDLSETTALPDEPQAHGETSTEESSTEPTELFPGAALSPVDYSSLDAIRDAVFISELQQFPTSYHEALIALHLSRPNWRFVAVPARDSWENIVREQMVPRRSLIEDNAANVAAGFVADHVVQDGYNFVQATRKAVEYYMDPRNFLNEPYIFMFERFSTLNSAQTLAGVEKIFEGNSDMLSIARIVFDAAKATNTSAYLLAGRIRIEVSEGSRMANNARGTIDVKYPPLRPGADSLSFMNREQQIAALNTYLSGYEAERQRYQAYQTDLEALAAAQNSYTQAMARHEQAKAAAASFLASAPTWTPGDLDGDEVITLVDLLRLRQALLGLRELSNTERYAADIDGHGMVTIVDLLRLRQALLGLRELP
ncbi:MAG: dockerin type I domain-containing protein [Bacillota bacterium]|nr:dockerin type I domain-containing protein [Bacillota bacterium]